MAIDISIFIKVINNVLSPVGSQFELNTLVLTSDEKVPLPQRVISFTDAESVGQIFGLTSDQYILAEQYFKGYDGATTIPGALLFGRSVPADSNGFIFGRTPNPTTLAEFQAITAGVITFVIQGTTVNLTAIDLSSDTSFSDVANTIETEFNNDPATETIAVTYDTDLQTFVVRNTTSVGSTSTVGYCDPGSQSTSSLGYLLGLTEFSGAVLSQGADQETQTESMDAIVSVTRNWISLASIMPDADMKANQLELAQWVSNDPQDRFTYIFGFNDQAVFTNGEISTIVYEIEQANYKNSQIIYTAVTNNDILIPAFVGGTIASINYAQTDGSIELAYRTQSSLTAENLTTAQAQILVDRGVNFFGDLSSAGNQFLGYFTGSITGTPTFGYITGGNFANNRWLNDQLTVALANAFFDSPKIPYNNVGAATIKSALQDPIQAAINAGVIESGTDLSDLQQTTINNQAGNPNAANDIFRNGYFVQILPTTAEQRQNRDPILVNFWYANGGAAFKITVNNTYVV